MNQPENSPDPLDQLLAHQPVKPAPDFAERTLARLQAEDATMDAGLDALFSEEKVKPSAGLADRVIAELNTAETAQPPEEDNKVIGFPSWVVAIGGIAAAMVFGMFCFISLFNYAEEQRQNAGTIATNNTAIVAPSDPVIKTPVAPVTEVIDYVMVAESPTPANSTGPKVIILNSEGLSAKSEVLEYETVLSMNDTLGDALLLADIDTLNTLQAFLN